MKVKIVFCAHALKQPPSQLPAAMKVDGNSVKFVCPESLKNEGFPVADAPFNVDMAFESPQPNTLTQKLFSTSATNFIRKRQNLVVFSYGVRSTPKRHLMYGDGSAAEGYAVKLMADVVQRGAGKGIFALSCYVLGTSERLIDLLNLQNKQGVIVESVKDGTRVRKVVRLRLTSAADVHSAMGTIVKSYQKVFAPVLCEKQPTPELEALPPYMPDTIILQLCRYEDEAAFKDYMETNSMTFVALGDSERPALCESDSTVQQQHNMAQRTLSSAAGIVSSIRSNKPRLPFGKSRFARLLRRPYNAENGNPHSKDNGMTETVFIVHAFCNTEWAEESFHCLSLIRRISNVRGSTGVISSTRDPVVNQWRQLPDEVELEDEPMNEDIVEGDDDDDKYIMCEEANPAPNGKVDVKGMNGTHPKPGDPHEEEAKLAQNGGTVHAEGATKTNGKVPQNGVKEGATDSTQSPSKMKDEPKANKGRGENSEQQSLQAMRGMGQDERRRQQRQWINQIKEIIAKILEQMRLLAEERKKSGRQPTSKESAVEKNILDGIQTAEKCLSKLIALDEIQPSSGERASGAPLQLGAGMHPQRLFELFKGSSDHDTRDVAGKGCYIDSLVDGILNYLRCGSPIINISSKATFLFRYFFLSRDDKRILAYDLDPQGRPLKGKKPTLAIPVKEIKEVVLGLYTSSFVNFSSEEQLAKTRHEVVTDFGTCHYAPTPIPNASNLGRSNYRAFAILLRGGKSIEVVCEKDSDWEAWLVALKRLLHIRTPVEQNLEERTANLTGAWPPSSDNSVTMKWGGLLDIQNMRDFASLEPEEATHCSENHVPPALFLRVKREMLEKSKSDTVTVYDIRVSAGLDLFRCSQLHQFLCERRIIPPPY